MGKRESAVASSVFFLRNGMQLNRNAQYTSVSEVERNVKSKFTLKNLTQPYTVVQNIIPQFLKYFVRLHETVLCVWFPKVVVREISR